MELNPKKNIESMLRPLVDRAKIVGENVLEITSGMVDVFNHPEAAAKNAETSIREQRRMLDMSNDVASGVVTRLAKHELSKEICRETVALLKIPEHERTEDNNLDLKHAAYMFDTSPGLMLGIGGLTDEETRTLSNFVANLHV